MLIWLHWTPYVGGYMNFLTKVILATPVLIFGAVMLSPGRRSDDSDSGNSRSSMGGSDVQPLTIRGSCVPLETSDEAKSFSTFPLSELPEDQCCSLAVHGIVRGPTYTGFQGQRIDTKVVSINSGRMRRRF